MVQAEINSLRPRNGLVQYLRTFQHQEGLIISEERKIIYMKPSRAAGTSIRRTLKKQIPDLNHKKADPEFYRNWISNITDQKLDQYFIFSAIRNPWDRVVSVESIFKIGWKKLLGPCITEGKWTDTIEQTHAIPVYGYSYFNGHKFVDFIIRYERLQEDYNYLCKIIGIESEPLPRYLKSVRKTDYRLYYNEDQKEVVRRAYMLAEQIFGDVLSGGKRRIPMIFGVFTSHV